MYYARNLGEWGSVFFAAKFLDLTSSLGSLVPVVIKNSLPGLEILENRIAPAVFHWAVSGDGNWNDQNNWFNETTGQAGDGFPNASADVAKFEDVLEARSAIRIPNGVTITVGSILFDDDFGYKIVEEGSGKLQLPSNGTITVESTNTAAHEILAPIELLGNITVVQDSSATLLLGGAISGNSAGIRKDGAGAVRLGGNSANTYTGSTTVLAGTLELAKTSGVAIPWEWTIGDLTKNTDATIRLFGNDQIVDQAGNARFLINPKGILDLNGFNDTINRLTLFSGSDAGSVITTGAGTLRTGDLLHSVLETGAVGARISGNLDLGSFSRDFTVSNGNAEVDLLIDANITGSGVFGKEGSGRLKLSGSTTIPNGNIGYGVLVYRGTLEVDGSISSTVLFASSVVTSLTGSGTVGGIEGEQAIIAPGIAGPGVLTSMGNVDLGSELSLDLFGTSPGTEYDQIVVNGTVELGGTIVLNLGYTPEDGDSFTIITNDGVEPVVGSFANLPEGAIFRDGEVIYRISYVGGDGNDVTLQAFVPEVNISANGKTATYTDVDGDLVTIKTTRGSFARNDFEFIPTGNTFNGLQLSLINLSDDDGEFANADITITAKRGAVGGNGFVNVGYINSTGSDLGKVTIDGDLGRITAGDGSNGAIKALTIGSLGQLGLSTQNPGGTPDSAIAGTVTKFVVKGDVRHNIVASGDDGAIGSITIGGSLNGGAIRADHDIGTVSIRGSVIGGSSAGSGSILSALGNIGAVKIGGSLQGELANFSGSIRADTGSIKSVLISGSVTTSDAVIEENVLLAPFGDGSIMAGAELGPVTIRGDVSGGSFNPVVISAGGSVKGVVKGVDLAIKKVAVTGNLEAARILAGYDTAGTGRNADASIGSISVGGDWIASTVLAGVNGGADIHEGTFDDAKISGDGVRDSESAFSQIASILIKGQAYGDEGNQSYGIVAEQIKSVRIGAVRLPLNPLPRSGDDFYPLAPTGPGPTGQPSDFTLLEVLPDADESGDLTRL